MIYNILSDGMPESITVNGVPFVLKTDYRLWLKAGMLFDKLDGAKDTYPILTELCDLVIDEYPEGDFVYGDDLIYGLLEFYKGFPKADNDYAETEKKKAKDKKKPPSFNFFYDAEYIYCSFVSFYGIRLQTLEYMHWWEFLVLFEGLMMSDQTSMNFVVGARQNKVKGKMSKEEKARIARLQKQFALPEDEDVKTAKNKLTSILGSAKPKMPTVDIDETP